MKATAIPIVERRLALLKTPDESDQARVDHKPRPMHGSNRKNTPGISKRLGWLGKPLLRDNVFVELSSKSLKYESFFRMRAIRRQFAPSNILKYIQFFWIQPHSLARVAQTQHTMNVGHSNLGYL